MKTRWIIPLAAVLLSGCVSTEPKGPETSPEDAAKVNLQLGAQYLQRGDLALARDKLKKAVELDPDLVGAQLTLGLVYERAGESDKAYTHYREAVSLAPDDPNVLNSYGGYLCRRDEREEGLEYFEKAARTPFYRNPQTAWSNAGVCARGIPDPERAEAFFRLALDKDPRYPEALLQMADLSLGNGNALASRAFLQRYEAVAPWGPDSLWLAVRVERSLGDYGAAGDYARRLRSDYPDSREARLLESGGGR